MRKHRDLDTIDFTPETRIGIHTVSNGSAWRLYVGKHPFGKNGGTRGTVRGGRGLRCVDAANVAGSHVGDTALLQYAMEALERIMRTGDGLAVAYALEVRAKLQEYIRMDKINRIAQVKVLFQTLGLNHVKGESLLP